MVMGGNGGGVEDPKRGKSKYILYNRTLCVQKKISHVPGRSEKNSGFSFHTYIHTGIKNVRFEKNHILRRRKEHLTSFPPPNPLPPPS